MIDSKSDHDPLPVCFDEALAKTASRAVHRVRYASLFGIGKSAIPARNGRYNMGLAASCALVLLYIGVDLFGFSLIVTAACDLDLTVTEKGVLTSLPFVGIFLVSYPWGYISDTRGRKFTLTFAMQAGFLLSSLCSLAPNGVVLGVVKFLSVCFSCAANSAAYTLVGESCMPQVRNKYMLLMTCLLLFSPAAAAMVAWPVLSLDFAAPIPLLNMVFRPWRLLCIVMAIPAGLGAIAVHFFQESPKFLATSGRSDEALDVLKIMYAKNHGGSLDGFDVHSLLPPQDLPPRYGFTLKGVWEQSAPLFRAPLLLRTLQLFYIVAVVYVTNNSFLVWLPHVLNLVKVAAEDGITTGNVCDLISNPSELPGLEDIDQTFSNVTKTTPECRGVDNNTLFTIMVSQAIFASLNFGISYLPNRRRIVLIAVLSVSATSGLLIGLMPEPVSSTVLFLLLTCTCLAMGILASFFVDFYPTSYRGMVACLSIMVGRSSTFLGVNIVGSLLFNHCRLTFFVWSGLIFSSVVAAWFLPRDTPRPAASKV